MASLDSPRGHGAGRASGRAILGPVERRRQAQPLGSPRAAAPVLIVGAALVAARASLRSREHTCHPDRAQRAEGSIPACHPERSRGILKAGPSTKERPFDSAGKARNVAHFPRVGMLPLLGEEQRAAEQCSALRVDEAWRRDRAIARNRASLSPVASDSRAGNITRFPRVGILPRWRKNCGPPKKQELRQEPGKSRDFAPAPGPDGFSETENYRKKHGVNSGKRP